MTKLAEKVTHRWKSITFLIATRQVDIEFQVDETKYDESNALVVDGSKQAGKKATEKRKPKIKQQPLSKKKRKKLERVLERRNNKLNVSLYSIYSLYFITDRIKL